MSSVGEKPAPTWGSSTVIGNEIALDQQVTSRDSKAVYRVVVEEIAGDQAGVNVRSGRAVDRRFTVRFIKVTNLDAALIGPGTIAVNKYATCTAA